MSSSYYSGDGVSTVTRAFSRSQLASQFSSLVDPAGHPPNPSHQAQESSDNDSISDNYSSDGSRLYYRLPRPKLIVPTHSYGTSLGRRKTTVPHPNNNNRIMTMTSNCRKNNNNSYSYQNHNHNYYSQNHNQIGRARRNNVFSRSEHEELDEMGA